MEESEITAAADAAARKRGKFLSSEYLTLIIEVASLRAHIASYGTDDFDHKDPRNGVLSGVRGDEIEELYLMLS
eukprot:IDg19773t1